MNFYHWLIVIIPMVCVVAVALYSRRFIRSVSDYIAAGRVAGRYVLTVAAGMEGVLGVISLVAMCEVNYQTGFALNFWNNVLLPVGLVLSLTGFCAYRFRETKALSMGQFLEMRYNRRLRIFAMVLRSFSEILANTIGPAVAARFFIYLLGLPTEISLAGFAVPTFVLLLVGVLLLAQLLILSGGIISLLITDCLQGLICYPIFVIFSVFLLSEFSWEAQIAPVMLDRVAGENFLNPYDIQELRDFNIFSLIVALGGSFLNRAVWFGGGVDSAARSPHEQKMAGILGAWRAGFGAVMCTLLAVALITLMNHRDFAGTARQVRVDLSGQVAGEVIHDPALRNAVTARIQEMPPERHEIGRDPQLSRRLNLDTPLLEATHSVLQENLPDQGEANGLYLKFQTLFYQMMLPAALRQILPPVLLALFVLLGLMLMVSTDDSRIFSSSVTIVQDIILPLRRTPVTPEEHLKALRWCTVGVSALFFVGSLFLSQLDYIKLFCIITTSIWIGGAGSMITFGLYSRRGNTAGAFASLLTGAGISAGGLLLQRHWPGTVYPLLSNYRLDGPLNDFLVWASSPFHPYLDWSVDPVKFPLNSMELLFFAMLLSVIAYWSVSLALPSRPFDLEHMLHRSPGASQVRRKINFRKLHELLVGITPDYTRGDRIIAWSIFGYSFIYMFMLSFVGVVIWNLFSRWPPEWWSYYFYFNTLVIPSIAGAVTTVWFFIGGVVDMWRLFRDLGARREIDEKDDGRVGGES